MNQFKSALHWLDNTIFSPRPQTFPDQTERNKFYDTNRQLFLFLFMRFTVSNMLLYLEDASSSDAQDFIMMLYIVWFSTFFLCCRRYPRFCKVFTTLLSPILIIFFCYTSHFLALISMLLGPIYLYYLFFITENFMFVLAIVGTLLTASYFYFQQSLKMAIEAVGVDHFTEKFVLITQFCLLLSLILTIILHSKLKAIHMTINNEKLKSQKAYRKLEEFIQGFSHELRNPLSSLKGNLDLAIQQNQSQAIKKYLEVSEVCTEVLLQLINNILDTGKADLSEVEVAMQPVNVKKNFKKLWKISNNLIISKGLFGSLSITSKVPTTLILDPTRISQILLNLVSNAIKFTDSGSIQVKIHFLEDKIKVDDSCFEPIPYLSENVSDAEEENDSVWNLKRSQLVRNFSINENIFQKTGEDENILAYQIDDFPTGNLQIDEIERNPANEQSQQGILKISVADTGCGMSNESLDKLFKRFSQVHDNAAQRQRGTGLGLYITKEIIKKLKGEIRAYSCVNVGTTIIVCIPMRSPGQQSR